MAGSDAAGSADIARDLAGEVDVDAAARRILQIVRDVAVTDHVGVPLVRGRGWRHAATSSEIAVRAGELQCSLGEGPIVDAATTRITVVSVDVVSDYRWPEWATRASSLGVHATLVACMYTAHRTVGALTAYSTRRR